MHYANSQSMPPHLPDFEEVLSEFFYVLLFSQSLLTPFPRMLSVAKLKCCPKTFQPRMRGCSFSECFGPQPLRLYVRMCVCMAVCVCVCTFVCPYVYATTLCGISRRDFEVISETLRRQTK